MSILSWKDKTVEDSSLEKINIYEYEPHQGTRLNDVGDIRITINNEDQFIHPSNSHLYVEGELIPKSGTTCYAKGECGISLVNNGLMYLFNRIDYSIANNKIEGYNNPGRATTMKGLLTHPNVYPEGLNFMWSQDEKAEIADNEGFSKRCEYIHSEGNGKFSAMIPLKHIFGFCENYDKVMYGAKHEICLHRSDDEDAILRSSEKGTGGTVDLVKPGKIVLTKLSWRMPIIKLSDKSSIQLLSDVKEKKVLPIEFLSRQCESIELNSGQRNLDWRLSVATGSERPRYVILAFQQNRYNRDQVNSAVFDNLNVRNAYVEFNSERYPNQNLDLDFSNNKFACGYQMLIDFYKNVMGMESCPVKLTTFKNLYPLLVFDISHQLERLRDTASDIRIKTEFDSNLPQNCQAYALVLSDRELQMQSDGNRMNIIH